MDVLSNLLRRRGAGPALAATGGLVAGLIFAWLIWPVQWSNVTAAQMREDLRKDYLRMAIDSYSVNNDVDLAVRRYQDLGKYAKETLSAVGADPGILSATAIQNFRAVIEIFQANLPDQVSSAPTTSPVQPTPQPSTPGPGLLGRVIPWFCGANLLLGVVVGLFLLVRRRLARPAERTAIRSSYQEPFDPQELEMRLAQPLPADEPLATFRTIYAIGDDVYDDSFSIEGPTGDFLGECGVGIGEVIGVGEPKKVSAFEVWLFDKNDIQTVTKVLMSRYAFNDAATRNRLAAKGDPVRAENGGLIELKTASLSVEARIVDLIYGEGALPSESFFERVTIELRAAPKAAA